MNGDDLMKRTEHKEDTRRGGDSLFVPDEYLRRIRAGLSVGRQREVFEPVKLSLIHYPDDPVFLSYQMLP